MLNHNEIKINNGYCVFFAVWYGSLLSLALMLSVHFGGFAIKVARTTDGGPKGFLGIILGIFLTISFLLLAKAMLVDFWACIKLYGLRINLRND